MRQVNAPQRSAQYTYSNAFLDQIDGIVSHLGLELVVLLLDLLSGGSKPSFVDPTRHLRLEICHTLEYIDIVERSR